MAIGEDLEVASFLKGGPKKLFIGGRWVEAAGGETFETIDPATGEVLARVAEGGAEDIDRAVASARRSFDRGTWRAGIHPVRGALPKGRGGRGSVEPRRNLAARPAGASRGARR